MNHDFLRLRVVISISKLVKNHFIIILVPYVCKIVDVIGNEFVYLIGLQWNKKEHQH